MSDILAFLNNPWISSILSGFVVYFVTNFFLSRKENREYSQKVRTANNELLYTMRPLVAQKQIPNHNIIKSLIQSIARKYEINRTDLLSLSLLADDLIREVMENPFLESDQKIEFCHKINEIVKINDDKVTAPEKIIYRKSGLPQSYISILLAAIASLIALSSSLISLTKDNIFFEGLKSSSSLFFPLFIPLFALMTVTIVLRIYMDKIDHDRNKRIKDDLKKKFNKQFLNEDQP